jgi:hypothetical protein
MGDPSVTESETTDDGSLPHLSRKFGWIFSNRAAMGMQGKAPRIETELNVFGTKVEKALIGCDGWRRCDWFEYLATTVDTPAEASAVHNYSSIPFGVYCDPI